MKKRSGELYWRGDAKGSGGTWNCATKLSGLNTEHLLELSRGFIKFQCIRGKLL